MGSELDIYVWEIEDGPMMTVNIPDNYDDGPTWTDLDISFDSDASAVYRKIARLRMEIEDLDE